MALLNYSSSYNNIESYLTTTNTVDKLKICISADKHFITHGVDLLSDYKSGARGLVPNFTGVQDVDNSNIYFGANGWQLLIATTADIENNSTSTVPSVAQMRQFMSTNLSAVDAMRFKGTVVFGTGENTNKIYVNGSIDPLTTCEAGDTYRIASNGKFNGVDVEPGDLLICIKDYDGENTPNVSDNDYWQIVLTNISGQAKLTLNGGTFYYYSPNINDKPTIFAPTTGGAPNQVLVSAGTAAAPNWTGLDYLISGSAKKLVETDGTTLISVGGRSKPVYFENGLPVECGIIAEASQVTHALTKGVGLSLVETGTTTETFFNGSKDVTIELNPANRSTLGGVRIPQSRTKLIDGFISDEDNLLDIDSSGNLTLVSDDIVSAIGGDINSRIKLYSVVLGEDGNATETKPIQNPYLNLISKTNDPGSSYSIDSSFQIVGAGHTTVNSLSVDGNNSLQISSTWRDILIGGESIGNKILSITPSDDIWISKDDESTTGVYEIGFGLMWYNLDESKFEVPTAE